MKILPLKKKDIPVFSRILEQVFHNKFSHILMPLQQEDSVVFLTEMHDLLCNDTFDSGNYVLIHEDIIIGMIQLSWKGKIKGNEKGIWKILRKRFGFFRSVRVFFLLRLMENKPAKKTLHIDAIGVDPKFQNQGNGKILLKFCEEKGNTLNLQYLELEVIGTNTGAKRLYEKTGFVVKKHKKTRLGKKLLQIPDYYIMVKEL
ncbi:MAG: GNAT family N-acetyltransferase [Promethearchaeota archaeon]